MNPNPDQLDSLADNRQYADALTRLRRRWWLTLLLPWEVGLLIAILNWLNIPNYLTNNNTTTSPWLCLGYFAVPAAVLYALLSMTFVPCPRCRKPFFRKGAFGNGFTRRCLHCKLPIR